MAPPQCTEDNDSEHGDTIFELLEKIPTLKGVQTSKKINNNGRQLIFTFKQHLPYNSDISDINEIIFEFQTNVV